MFGLRYWNWWHSCGTNNDCLILGTDRCWSRHYLQLHLFCSRKHFYLAGLVHQHVPQPRILTHGWRGTYAENPIWSHLLGSVRHLVARASASSVRITHLNVNIQRACYWKFSSFFHSSPMCSPSLGGSSCSLTFSQAIWVFSHHHSSILRC